MEIQWALVVYSLCMGLSIGPFALLALTDQCEKRSGLCKLASLVGLGSITVAGLSAFSHLLKPLNALYMFSNLGSPMTQETLVVLLTGVVAALLAAALYFNWLPGVSRRVLAWIGLGLAVLSVVMIATIYLLPARPAWNTWLLPLTLLASSLANGLLLAWVLAAVAPQPAGETGRGELVEKLRGWALPILAGYAVISIIFLMVAASNAGGIARLLTGDLALLFWLGLVVVGLAAPGGLVWLAKKNSSVNALAAFAMVVAGGLVVRAMLFPLGTRVPLTNLW